MKEKWNAARWNLNNPSLAGTTSTRPKSIRVVDKRDNFFNLHFLRRVICVALEYSISPYATCIPHNGYYAKKRDEERSEAKKKKKGNTTNENEILTSKVFRKMFYENFPSRRQPKVR